MAITYPALPGQNIIQQVTGSTTNGYSQGVNLISFPQNNAIPVQTDYTFIAVPATPSATAIAQVQTPTNNALVLNTVNTPAPPVALNVFIESIVSPYLGSNCIVLDMERQAKLTFSAKPTTVGVTATMNGYDYRGVQCTQTSSALNAISGTTYLFPNPISVIQSITFSASLGGSPTVSAGTNSSIGLPYYLHDLSFVSNLWWNNSPVTPSTSNISIGNNWRSGPPLTAASVTVPCRGLVNLPSAPTSAAKLVCSYFVYGEDSELNGQIANLNQSSLSIAGITPNTSLTAFVMPTLLVPDTTGVQYPGDLTFATAYANQLAS